MDSMPTEYYWMQFKTNRVKHYPGYGRGAWSRVHLLPGRHRQRIEGETVRFLCGTTTDTLTASANIHCGPLCSRCVRAQAKIELGG